VVSESHHIIGVNVKEMHSDMTGGNRLCARLRRPIGALLALRIEERRPAARLSPPWGAAL